MRQMLSHELHLPIDGKTISPEIMETGLLRSGNGNLRSRDYDSLTDFAYSSGVLEIRIPWQLINFMDPSQGQVVGRFGEGEITKLDPLHIDSVYVGGALLSSAQVQPLNLGFHAVRSWDLPNYHERLKSTYYTLRGLFAKY